jgi:putative Mn2+ efflux pump MntP
LLDGGLTVASLIANYDHWVAFGQLAIVGIPNSIVSTLAVAAFNRSMKESIYVPRLS